MGKTPKNLGLAFTRSPKSSVGETNTPDAYVWVTPDLRGEGVATAALNGLSKNLRADGFNMPFEVNPKDAAAVNLVDRFAVTAPEVPT